MRAKSQVKVHLLSVGLGTLWSGCAAQPENPDAGTCALSCSSPRVGAAEFAITPMEGTNQNFTVGCQAPTNSATPTLSDASQPIMVRWQVTEKIAAFPGGSSAGGTASSSSSSSGLGLFGDTPDITQEPVAGVAFEPFLEGLMSVDKTNPQFQNGNSNSVTPARFMGVVTPSSEWCSDSCGVISYEFWPMCAPTNNIQASVFVGGANVSTAAYSYAIIEQ